MKIVVPIRKITSHVECVAPRFSSFRVAETGDNANRTPYAIALHLGLAQFPLALRSHSQFYRLGVVLLATHAVDYFWNSSAVFCHEST